MSKTSDKRIYKAIGLMSGTSLDGIDIALLETDGEAIVKPGSAATFAYSEGQREILRVALKAAIGIVNRDDRGGVLASAEQSLTQWHVEAVGNFLKTNRLDPKDIDLIGFHGQTVIHRPELKLTVQLGDGVRLAQETGIQVAFDLRSADVAAGGQGAPLVPAYHRALAAQLSELPVVFVNIGGVGNITFIGSDGALLAFDTGPGNALIDDWMKSHTGKSRDENGATALSGVADESVLSQFLNLPFFGEPGPKSLDRNSFAHINLDHLDLKTGAATLVEVTSQSIAAAVQHMPEIPKAWIICGGGRHNKAIMRSLNKHLAGVLSAEYFGFNGDSMEAEAWAYLAVRCLKRLPLSFPGTTGVSQALTGGTIVSV